MFGAKWCLFMGGLCTFIYTCAVLYTFTGMVGVHDLGKVAPAVEKAASAAAVDPDSETDVFEDLQEFSRAEIATYTLRLVSDIFMLVASILLIVGLKKQLHKFMAPWIYVSILSIIATVVDMFFGEESTAETHSYFAIIFAIAVMWYPIYKQYKFIRNSKCQKPTSVEQAIPAAEFSHCGQQHASAPVHE